MARGGTREARTEVRVAAISAEGAPATGMLDLIVEGLLARVEASTLMRKPPAQCTPEEQAELIELLSSLAALRATQAALAAVPGIAPALVDRVWPELAGVLAGGPPGRGGRRAGGAASGTLPASIPPALPADVVDVEAPDAGVAFAGAPAPPGDGHTPGEGALSAAEGRSPMGAYRDLGEAVLHVLRTDRRPWSASRIAARLQEADPLTPRKDVYDTLWHHPDLFRRTGHGWELTAR